jgi:inner membrane protein
MVPTPTARTTVRIAASPLDARGTAWAWAAMAWIVVADALLRTGPPSRLVEAVVDEVAHLATALLLLWGPRWPAMFLSGALAGSVLIDLDHIPGELGWDVLSPGAHRPFPHSLATVAALALAALAVPDPRRALVLGVAAGMATHLFRDMAMGGVPLLWPIAVSNVAYPHALYTLAMVAALGRVLLRGRGRPPRR